MTNLLVRLKATPLPFSLDPADIPQARELERVGYIEATLLPRSKGRETYGEERGAVVKRITSAGMAKARSEGA